MSAHGDPNLVVPDLQLTSRILRVFVAVPLLCIAMIALWLGLGYGRNPDLRPLLYIGLLVAALTGIPAVLFLFSIGLPRHSRLRRSLDAIGIALLALFCFLLYLAYSSMRPPQRAWSRSATLGSRHATQSSPLA